MPESEKRRRFEASVLVHLDAAYTLARWIVRDDHLAQDVVQEAALRAFRHFDGLLGPSPRAWFMAIVRNACLDAIETRRNFREDSYDPPRHESLLSGSLEIAETPETRLIRTEDARVLHAAMRELPIEYREVLVLREFAGMSYKEIGAVAGIPIGTVMSRLARGRDLLARKIVERERRQAR